MGGQHIKLPGLENAPGGNPSVHWNTYLKKWVMVWHGWSPPKIYMSVSEDGVHWEEPKNIIISSISGRAWYPTIIGNSDVEADQIAKIYYADIAGDFSFRNLKPLQSPFLMRKILHRQLPESTNQLISIGFHFQIKLLKLKQV